MSRLLSILFWSVIAAAFIGPGTVTTAASSGARFGYALLWALAFSTLATVVLQEASARVTLVSGRNLAEAIRAQFRGRRVGLLVLLLVLGAIVVGNAAYEAGNILGAVAGAELGMRASRSVLTLLIGGMAGVVLWIGTPRMVATLLSVTVAFMGVAFLVTAMMLRPPWGEVLSDALIPSFPPGSALLVLGLIGTTVVPYNLFLGSGIAGGQDLREARFGIAVAVVLGGIISMGILVVGAAVEGEFGFGALQATLERRLGKGAGSLFAWGLFAAGLSSAITAPLAAAITARSLFDDERRRWEPGSWRYRAVWLSVLLVGVGFGLAGVRPIPAIILAQALNGVVLPFAAVFLLVVVNDRALMGEAGLNGPVANALMGLIVLVTVVLGTAGVLRAAAAAFGLPAPDERVLLGGAALVAAALAVPVARWVRARRGAGRRRAAALTALPLLVAVSACSAPPPPPPAPEPDGLLVPGVSRELARQRAATLSGVEYDLSLDLTGTDSVPGELVLSFRREAGAGDLVVDYRGPALLEVRANGRRVPDHRWTEGHVLVPARHLRAGRNSLLFRFTSRMAAAGASVIRYEEPSERGHGETYLYTLLVPADANQLFPAFDQPDLKAVFRMALTVPEGWRVLANAPLEERSPAPGGVRWRFAPTEPISTYLAAFAAGPWQTWESAPAGRLPITLYARAARAPEVDADTLIAINRRAVEWLEGYFGMRFPFAKFDMLLAPAFPFGGMEHPGAIFYNESRFVFREPPTLTERLGRSATIYHEVAHQWFGDLVTMEWFDDLWLKEGFSTYMAARMQEELNPGTGAWKTFYLRNKPPAYGVDATRGTTPVWQALENLDLAKSNYGPIVYNKAPAILKQLNYLVGEDAFRAGLRALLREYAYANITWRDLLDALEESSGQDLDAFGEHYILRAGMPEIEPLLRVEDGKIAELRLVQRPARELEGDPGGWWPGRVRVRLGYDDRADVVIPLAFTGETTAVQEAVGLPAPAFVFANDGDYGYGRFLLDPRSAEALIAGVGEIEDDLLRAMVWGALWDRVGEGRLATERYLELTLRELPPEADEQIAAFLLGRGTTALERYLAPEARARFQAPFERLLLARMSDPALPYGLRKASLDALLEIARTPEAVGTLLELLAGERAFDGEPLRQPSRWAAIQTLLAVGHPAADSLYRAEQARDTSPEAARRAFVAGAAVPSAQNKAEYFRRYLEDPELNEEWVTASLGAFNHPDHTELTLPFLRPALDRLPWIQQNRRIFFLPQWIGAFVGGQRGSAALAVVDAYLAEHPELPDDLRRKVLQERDELERVVEIREQGAGNREQ